MSLGRQIQLRKLVRQLLIVLLGVVWITGAQLSLSLLIEPVLAANKQLSLHTDLNLEDWLLTWPIFLVIIPLIAFPVWRSATWLNAITYNEATKTDLKRILIWINVFKGINLLSALIVIAILFYSIYIPNSNNLNPFILTGSLFSYIIAFIILGFLAKWVNILTQLQGKDTGRYSVIYPIIMAATPFIRILQIFLLGESLVVFFMPDELSSFSIFLQILSSILDILLVELGLRFAHITAQDIHLPQPSQ